jgi:hypothetical protein
MSIHAFTPAACPPRATTAGNGKQVETCDRLDKSSGRMSQPMTMGEMKKKIAWRSP